MLAGSRIYIIYIYIYTLELDERSKGQSLEDRLPPVNPIPEFQEFTQKGHENRG